MEEENDHPFDIFEHKGERVIMCVAGVFMLAFVVGNFLHRKHVSFVSESLVVIIFGAISALLWRFFTGTDTELTLQTDASVNKKLLTMIFLPIIIFEAGWSIRNREFIAQLPYILIFAVLGTVICMVVVALLIMATRPYHKIQATRTAFTYGALIAAVDPVATLATYAHLNVEPLLNTLVMGESIINDAVAIVLFEVLNEKEFGFFGTKSLLEIILNILLGVCDLLGCSVLIGLLLGGFYSFVLRVARMRETPTTGILFVTVSCFFTYHFAESVCGKSGIIAVLFSGMIMNATSTPHLSLEGALLTSFLLKQLSSLADMSVFMFVGFAAVFLSNAGLVFGCWVMLFCLVGRAAATFPLAALSNCIKAHVGKDMPKEQQLLLSWRHMVMMWHAGLRGGIALVLTLSLEDWVDDPRNGGTGQKETLRNATVLLICVFLLVFGGTTECLLKRLNIPHGDPPPMRLQTTRATAWLFWLYRTLVKPVLRGSGKNDFTMHGSVLKRLIEEHESGPRRESSAAEVAQDHWDLFGRTDPIPRSQSQGSGGDCDIVARYCETEETSSSSSDEVE